MVKQIVGKRQTDLVPQQAGELIELGFLHVRNQAIVKTAPIALADFRFAPRAKKSSSIVNRKS